MSSDALRRICSTGNNNTTGTAILQTDDCHVGGSDCCLCVSCYNGVCVVLQWCLDMYAWVRDGHAPLSSLSGLATGSRGRQPDTRSFSSRRSSCVVVAQGASFLSVSLLTAANRCSRTVIFTPGFQSTRDADVPAAQQLVWMQVIVATPACRRLWLPWRGQRNHPARLSAPHFLNLDKLTSQASCRDSPPTRKLVCHHVQCHLAFLLFLRLAVRQQSVSDYCQQGEQSGVGSSAHLSGSDGGGPGVALTTSVDHLSLRTVHL
ncbi:hypothetical protein C0Q70_10260 [Pomacea canaliculata]|uniref:Uncharacterized protein n=1 Tax=Pomacea canaliculata TaxID=400727 RepID=A0A2T7PC37_POMCA|nr:hypothetical protein C0Q70_10260 [Pomacea canaliculata]